MRVALLATSTQDQFLVGVFLHVLFSGPAISERKITLLTGVRFFSRVTSDVSQQDTAVGEFLLTVCTLEGPFSCVPPLMCLPGAVVRERGSTRGTFINSIPRVHFHVPLETVAVAKIFMTLRTFGSLSIVQVGSNMGFQVSVLSESFVAHITRKWSLSVMDSNVAF